MIAYRYLQLPSLLLLHTRETDPCDRVIVAYTRSLTHGHVLTLLSLNMSLFSKFLRLSRPLTAGRDRVAVNAEGSFRSLMTRPLRIIYWLPLGLGFTQYFYTVKTIRGRSMQVCRECRSFGQLLTPFACQLANFESRYLRLG